MKLLKSVHRTILPRLTELGFCSDVLCSDDRAVVLVKRIRRLVCCYLRVRYRVDLDADLWIAPIEYPDDRIGSLPCYRIEILPPEVTGPLDDVLSSVALRVLGIRGTFSGFAEAVKEQIQLPIFKTDRAARFCDVRAAYETIRAAIDRPDDPVPSRIDELAAQTAAGELSADGDLLVECTTVAKRIIKQGMPASFERPTFEGKARKVGMEVAAQFYMEALLFLACGFSTTTPPMSIADRQVNRETRPRLFLRELGGNLGSDRHLGLRELFYDDCTF